ncbi:MAG: hypothetical protein QNL33_19015 [Akkermansiaceae bacterium]|jgi:hypothetical protein
MKKQTLFASIGMVLSMATFPRLAIAQVPDNVREKVKEPGNHQAQALNIS